MFRASAGILGLVVTVALVGCASDQATSGMAGDCANAFGGEVCTWAVMEGETVVEVGATIPLSAIEGAPGDASFTWPPATEASIPLPAADQTGLTHLTMNWEPVGHPPQTFLVPHFDFHFYLISEADRVAIDCSQLMKPAEVPAGYEVPDETLPPEIAAITGVDTLIGVCVPEMGMHALPTADMANPEPFDGTMIVGYYEGEPIFVEPMIAQAFLMERQSFELAVPRIPGRDGIGPTGFRAEYDEAQDAYRFTFSIHRPGD